MLSKLVKYGKKHVEDVTTPVTEGQKKIRKPTGGQRATRRVTRIAGSTGLGIGALTAGTAVYKKSKEKQAELKRKLKEAKTAEKNAKTTAKKAQVKASVEKIMRQLAQEQVKTAKPKTLRPKARPKSAAPSVSLRPKARPKNK